MKKIIILILCVCNSALAATHYADLNSPSPTPPYTSWATAATNIQNAVDVAEEGGVVLVADGHYILSEQITISTNNISVKSVNGSETTIIDGGGLHRCLYISSVSNFISGFTITDGYASEGFGAGICCIAPYNGIVVSNCVIRNNYLSGGSGGGMYRGTAYDCIIRDNICTESAGGLLNASAYRCVISGNSAQSIAGGMWGGEAHNCTIIDNYSGDRGGGIALAGAYNCTIIDNYAENEGSGIYKGEAYNCILYHDQQPPRPNIIGGDPVTVSFSCAPTLHNGALGNITNEPSFMDGSSGSYRLLSNSICIDSGFNTYVQTDTDADGNPRIVNGMVDMGAYEFQTEETRVNIPLRVILEHSPDLDTWTNSGKFVEWLLPADSSNEFYRVRLEIEAF